MKSVLAVIVMVIWSAAIGYGINMVGFQNHLHDVWWSLGAAVVLLIGLIGNVWIYFLIAQEEPFEWPGKGK